MEEFKFLELLANQLPDSVYWKDLEGRYLGCNDKMVQISGYESVEEIIGKTDEDMSWHDIAAELRRNDAQVIAAGSEYTFEEIGMIPGGKYLVARSRKIPLRDAQGNIIGILGVSTDITSLVSASKELFNNAKQTDEMQKFLLSMYQQVTGIDTLSKDISAFKENSVLLVSNSPITQKTLQANLPLWGMGPVDIADTVSIALDKIMQKTFDLIFVDLNLPEYGCGLVEKLRKERLSINQKTPVIGLAASDESKLERLCLAAGMSKIYTKPLLGTDAKKIAIEFLIKEAPAMIVDWDLWRKRCGGHEDLVKQAFEMTMRDLPEAKQKTIQALQIKDYETLENVVHKCYGGLRYCGLPQLETATLAFEQAIRGKQYADIEKLHQDFIQQITAALTVKAP